MFSGTSGVALDVNTGTLSFSGSTAIWNVSVRLMFPASVAVMSIDTVCSVS